MNQTADMRARSCRSRASADKTTSRFGRLANVQKIAFFIWGRCPAEMSLVRLKGEQIFPTARPTVPKCSDT